MLTVAHFFSWLGDWERVVLIGITFLIVLMYYRQYREAWFLSGVVAIAKLLSVLLKELFERIRPDMTLWLTDASGFAFPSGHATVAMALYGGLGYLAWRQLKHLITRYLTLVICFILVVGIGLSRVYLRVHWLTDVLGGWLLGAAVLLFLDLTVIKRKWG